MTDDTDITIRCSTLSGYPDCPRRAAANIFWRDVRDAGYTLTSPFPSIAAHIGSAVHEGARTMLAHKAVHGVLPLFHHSVNAAVNDLEVRARDQGALYDEQTKHIDEARHQVRRMTSCYVPIAQSVDPILVEERLEAQASPGVILSGQPDNVCRQPHALRDLKSGRARPNMKPQIGGYSMIARSNGLPIEKGYEDYIPRVAINKPQPKAQTFEHDLPACEAAAQTILHHILDDITAFRKGDSRRHLVAGDPWAFIANPNSRLCSPKYCKAHSTPFCTEWKSKE